MSWLRRIVNTFRRAPLDRAIDREIAFHLHEREDDLRDQGLSSDDARRTSRMRFGSPLAQRDRTRTLTWFTGIGRLKRGVTLEQARADLARVQVQVALRLALGALRTTVVKQLIATSIRVVAAASVVGLGMALLFTRSLATMLYGVTPADPATLTGVVAVVVTVASIAATVPAARVVFMQPMRALRDE
jgi:hypothetical protein